MTVKPEKYDRIITNYHKISIVALVQDAVIVEAKGPCLFHILFPDLIFSFQLLLILLPQKNIHVRSNNLLDTFPKVGKTPIAILHLSPCKSE